MYRNCGSFLWVFVFVCLVNAQSDADLDKLIDEVFNNNKNDTANRNPDVNNLPPAGNKDGTTGSCTCVPYYLCNNGSINTDGTGIIDIRINEQTGTGKCESYLEDCCTSEATTDKPIIPTPPPNKQSGCGRRNPDGVGFRITGDKDNEAQFGEFPWMVAVLREEYIDGNSQKLNIYQCGGALIHPQAVITAAHCVNGKDKSFKIRAGEWDTQTKKELFPYQDRNVASIKIHPQFYAGALFNDIAILFLESPVEIAENVDVVCLPPQGTVIDNARCYASGWGKDVFGKEGKYQVILKRVDLPIVPRDACEEALRKTRLGKHFDLHQSFICAGGEAGKDTCKGDGGSPLVCPIQGENERYIHAGIVAWGIGCGEDKTPGVYANVALFRNWIDEQMQLNNLDTKYYQY